MADTTAMSVTLPQVIVEDIVKAEIVRHLGKQDELVGALLRNVMGAQCQCDRHRYSNPKRSVFACELEKQIEALIKEIVSQWITAERSNFEKELHKRLSRPDQLKAMVSAFAAGIQTGSWNVAVRLETATE